MYFNLPPLQGITIKTAIIIMDSLTLQVDGPITGRAYKRGGGGLVSGILRYHLQ